MTISQQIIQYWTTEKELLNKTEKDYLLVELGSLHSPMVCMEYNLLDISERLPFSFRKWNRIPATRSETIQDFNFLKMNMISEERVTEPTLSL